MKLALVVCVAIVAFAAVSLAKKDKKGPAVTNKVFFDIEIDGKASGRIVIELYGTVMMTKVVDSAGRGSPTRRQDRPQDC